MAPQSLACSHCGYEIQTYAEVLEAHEGGAHCLLCGGELDAAALEKCVDAWKDPEVILEGAEKARSEAEFAEEEELFEGSHDFGDEGEDEEDPLF